MSSDFSMTKSVGRISAISISAKKGIPKSNVKSAELIKDYGIKGDAHAGNWHRQVSFLAMESIDTMRQKGLPALRPGAFAENITTEFIDVPNIAIGTKVQLGNTAIIEITQIGKECHSKCAIFDQVGDCVMPREGIFGIVIKGGIIEMGDSFKIISIPIKETTQNDSL
ncbi:MAG: MOSC domain-containing protein [Bacteroidota bacterium]|nr:MOSC domain-containing protein [Bacteroidota bacterium]